MNRYFIPEPISLRNSREKQSTNVGESNEKVKHRRFISKMEDTKEQKVNFK